jgi:cell division septation protein DedD
MANEQFEKLLARHDPVGVGPVAPARPPQTFVHEQQKRGQATRWNAAKNWPRIRAVFKVRTRRRARRLLRWGCGVLVLGAVAHLGYLALVDDDRPAEQDSIPLADNQQTAISDGTMHSAPPEERSVYSLANTPPDLETGQAKSRPPLSPGGNVPASDGGYVVQVSAERSDTEAQASFKTIQSRYPDVLGGRSLLIRRVDLGAKGIVYRAQIGPFDTLDQAKQLCGRLKAAGGHCIVQGNS